MINNWKQFNEDMNVNLTESSYITILEKERVDVSCDHDKQGIDYVCSKDCKVYWSVEIIDDKNEMTSIRPIISKIELILTVTYWKQPYDEDEIDNTYDKEESYLFTSKNIKIENSYKDEIQFPFRPRGINFDLREKSEIEIDFNKYDHDEN